MTKGSIEIALRGTTSLEPSPTLPQGVSRSQTPRYTHTESNSSARTIMNGSGVTLGPFLELLAAIRQTFSGRSKLSEAFHVGRRRQDARWASSHPFLSRALHPDKNNLSPNRIIALGNFTGRELWCEDKIGKVKFMLITP